MLVAVKAISIRERATLRETVRAAPVCSVSPFLQTDGEPAVERIRIVVSGAVSDRGSCGNTGDSPRNCGGGGGGTDLISAVGGGSSDRQVEARVVGEGGGGSITESNANDHAPSDDCDDTNCLLLSSAKFANAGGLMAATAVPAFIVGPATIMMAA